MSYLLRWTERVPGVDRESAPVLEIDRSKPPTGDVLRKTIRTLRVPSYPNVTFNQQLDVIEAPAQRAYMVVAQHVRRSKVEVGNRPLPGRHPAGGGLLLCRRLKSPVFSPNLFGCLITQEIFDSLDRVL